MARERILVTGGGGFIGACLSRALIAAGPDVHLLLRGQGNPWRLAGLEGRCTHHPADLRDADAVRRSVAAARPAVVYHLATFGATAAQTDRSVILTTNLLGTANLLDAMHGHDCRAFVHVGSSSEYGHKDGPLGEGDRLLPRTDYGVAKAAATLLCQAEARRGRPVVTVRVFSAYGPWEDSGRLVPHVMGCCLRGESPRLTAGRQPRDFIHVDDVIALLQTAADRPDLAGEVLHAGTGAQLRVRDMVETIVAVSGQHDLRPEFGAVPTRPDEPETWLASIDRTVALTGWRPRLSLRAGVEQTWAWFAAAHARAA